MELAPYLEEIRDDILRAGELGGDEVRATVLRLLPAVDPAVRLALINALTDHAADITHQLETIGTPAVVQVQLAGRDPITRVRAYETPQATAAEPDAAPTEETDDDGSAARITLRLPEGLKARAEAVAEAEGVSLNSYVVECVRRVTGRRDHRRRGHGFPPPPPGAWQPGSFPPAAPPPHGPGEPPSAPSRRLNGWL